MNIKAPVVVAACQVLLLGFLAGEREWILQRGRTVFLRTAPVDPRDVMRGDYVRLDYDISRVDASRCRDGLADAGGRRNLRPDTRVYASLRVDAEGLGHLSGLSDRRPTGGLFIRGRAKAGWNDDVQVRYGIEAWFMEQGQVLGVEQEMASGQARRGMDMEVAVGANGAAVLKGRRWTPLAIGLALQRATNAPAGAGGGRQVLAAEVSLLNASSNDVAIVDLPRGGSFALLTDVSRWGVPSLWRWVNQDRPIPDPAPADVVVLKPGRRHALRIDFLDPSWHLVRQAQAGRSKAPIPLGNLPDPEGWLPLRLVYRPPDAQACRQLPNALLIWHGRLPTQIFTPRGSAD